MHLDLPVRRGPKPQTTPDNPHMQLDQQPDRQSVRDELADQVFALPEVEERPSGISVPGARALCLVRSAPAGPQSAFMIDREFAHLHPDPDMSLHLTLPEELGAEAVDAGWAELHPVARLGAIPPTAFMVFAPREDSEREVVRRLVEVSHAFARGRARSAVTRSGARWWSVLSSVGCSAVTPPQHNAHVNLQVESADRRLTDAAVVVQQVLLAGYTGRDRHAVLEHVRELEALGVAPPRRIPSVFVVEPWSVQVTDTVDASGSETSGEVEAVLICSAEGLLVGVGSDHTDRAHEPIDIDESKRMCSKPIAPVIWRYSDVAGHWDELELRSWTSDGNGRRLYQEGTLAEFLPVDALFKELRDAGFDAVDGTVVFGGTLPTLGGLEFGQRFEIELRDPVLDRFLSCGYAVARPPDRKRRRADHGELASDA